MGDVSPALSQRLEKIALIFCKSALLVAIYDLNLSFKMQFLNFYSRRTPKVLPVWPFFLVLCMKDV